MLQKKILDSIEPVNVLLSTIFKKLELHGKNFSIFVQNLKKSYGELISELSDVDPSLELR